MTPSKSICHNLAPIIRRLLTENRYRSNQDLATMASQELGRPVSIDLVSRTRVAIHMSAGEMRLQSLYHLQARDLLDVPEDANAPWPSDRKPLHLIVSNLSETRALYELLGLSITPIICEEAYTGLDGFRVQLTDMHSPRVRGIKVSSPVSFTIPARDLDRYATYLRNRELDFLDRNSLGVERRQLIVSDLDGHKLVFVQAPTEPESASSPSEDDLFAYS